MSRETRVRYGRTSTKAPKNTLVTLRQGDTVYFGVARCNTKAGDAFKRTLGTTIAANRARAALDGAVVSQYTCPEGTVSLHTSGMRGAVPVAEVRALLTYFRQVDTLRRAGTVLSDVKAG
jgi:hypothetical protein